MGEVHTSTRTRWVRRSTTGGASARPRCADSCRSTCAAPWSHTRSRWTCRGRCGRGLNRKLSWGVESTAGTGLWQGSAANLNTRARPAVGRGVPVQAGPRSPRAATQRPSRRRSSPSTRSAGSACSSASRAITHAAACCSNRSTTACYIPRARFLKGIKSVQPIPQQDSEKRAPEGARASAQEAEVGRVVGPPAALAEVLEVGQHRVQLVR